MSQQRRLSEDLTEKMMLDLKTRFTKNQDRHPNFRWSEIESRLRSQPSKLWSLYQMESTGGEPDVIGRNDSGEFLFCDCSAETPKGRRSICYDREAQDSRKEHRPENNAVDMAAEMGITLLTEQQYHELQTLGTFDSKTSSWLDTPADIRDRGGAIFGDFRYGRVFVYHNGAQSYYAVRGFRGILLV